MRHNEQELDSFNGGSANGYNGQFQQQLPSGVTIKEIELIGTNLNNNQIDKIEIDLNGDNLYSVSGEHLRMLQNYKGEYIEDSRWIIPFADFSAETQEGQNKSSLITLPGDNARFKVYTAATTPAQVAAGNVADIRANAVFGATQATRPYLPRMYTDTLTGSKAGENKHKDFVVQNKASNPVLIRRAHMLNPDISHIELKRNKVSIFDKSLIDQNYSLRRFGLVPQDNIYHLDPIKTRFAKVDMLAPGSKFEIISTLDSAGDFDVLYETLEILTVAQG